VSVFGTSAAQSLAGQSQAERVETAEKRKAERAGPREARSRKDEHDSVVVDVETLQAVRHLAGNDQEQAHEDRREHPYYTPSGQSRAEAGRPRLDIEG
jgi:hypothetical protein